MTSSATLGSGSTFMGTILALTSITMNSGVTVNGRALARNGNVTLINDKITMSTCSGIPNIAFSGSEPSAPMGPALFALVLIGSLGALTMENVRTARRRM